MEPDFMNIGASVDQPSERVYLVFPCPAHGMFPAVEGQQDSRDRVYRRLSVHFAGHTKAIVSGGITEVLCSGRQVQNEVQIAWLMN